MKAELPYGFRIVGDCRQERRLVDLRAAFVGYATCDERAEVTGEAYLSAFALGDEFRLHLQIHGTTKGYTGPCWPPWLWFDIDREDDLEAATRDARRLCTVTVDRYRIDGDGLLIFFSGAKGFHIGLPSSLWQPEPSAELHKAARWFAEHLATIAGVSIDTGIYDPVRAFRAPNSRHPKTGLQKRRLEFDELLYLTTAAIVDRASKPEPFDLPADVPLCDTAVADWQESTEAVHRQAVAYRERHATSAEIASLNRQTLDFIRDGAPEGERHLRLFSAAANLAEFGCPSVLAHALLSESALDSGLPPREVRRQIQCGLSHSITCDAAGGGAPCP